MKIVKYPHPALRHQSRPLTMIDKQVRLQAGQMLELMYEAHGLGLAANQVGWPFQLLVMNHTADPEQSEQERVVINPVVVERQGMMEGEEGCLSFPELFQKVRRPKMVTVHAYNLDGQAVEISCSDMPSRILQHEIDHLHGVLFVDKFGTIARMSSRGRLRELEREFRKAQEKGTLPPDEEIIKMLRAMEIAMEQADSEKPAPEPPTTPPVI